MLNKILTPYLLCNQYQTLANLTSAFYPNNWGTRYNANEHLIMATMGIVGEYFEFLKSLSFTVSLDVIPDTKFEKAKRNTMLEVGDVCWYIAEMCTWAGTQFGAVYATALNLDGCTVYDIGALAEHVKKYVFHNKKHGLKHLEFLPVILSELLITLKELDLDLYDVLNENLLKLNKRHGEKFNNAANLEVSSIQTYDAGCA